MWFLPLTTTASSTTKFVYKKMMEDIPYTSATIYKGVTRGIVSLVVLAVMLGLNKSVPIDSTSAGVLLLTQVAYIGISFYHMYLLSTTSSPTVLGAVVSCCLLISSLLVGRFAFGEIVTSRQMLGIALAIVAIILMTL